MSSPFRSGRKPSAPRVRRAGKPVGGASRLPMDAASPSRYDRGSGPSEDGGPVVAHADHGPVAALGLVEHLLGAGGVRELPGGVVVADEQPEEGRVGVLGEL